MKVRLNLIESKARAFKVGGVSFPKLLALFKSIKLDFRVIIAALLICVAAFAYGSFQAMPLKQDLNNAVSRKIKVGKISPEVSYEALNLTSIKDRKTLDSLDNLIRKQLYVTEVLDIMPRALPEGVWLTKFYLAKKEEGKAELILEGMSYLGDSNNEFQAVNKFFNNLQESPVFTKYFKDINIVSLDHAQFAGATVTTFFISCKTYKGAK